jgi:transglutaminase/protease-like cytokinesis protein 3
VVGKKTARINWKKSKNADGYILYRRMGSSKNWKKIASVADASRNYAYDTAVVANKTYYYMVKAYAKIDGKKIYADYDATGFKVSFSKVTVGLKNGDYKSGSVYGPSLNSTQLSQVKKAVQKFCDGYITSDMTDVEKAMVAQLYLASNCAYAATWAKNGANTAWGALVYKNSSGYHEAQCSGFARGYKALCDGMGVECRYIHANSKSANPSHQWNEVKIDKKWYIVDPQCNAISGGFFFFLCSGSTYTNETGMTWDKASYPTVSSKDYSAEKLGEAAYGYKVQRMYKKIFK